MERGAFTVATESKFFTMITLKIQNQAKSVKL